MRSWIQTHAHIRAPDHPYSTSSFCLTIKYVCTTVHLESGALNRRLDTLTVLDKYSRWFLRFNQG